MQQSSVKFYCFVVQTLLNMFRVLLCPSSGARQTAVAASGFRMKVEVDVFSAGITNLICTYIGLHVKYRLLLSYFNLLASEFYI